ncbi:MAG: histone deacetylase [Sedimentisphaerales bacterium]|nr:histone deacetylase [Sedimentisphaerales bacterium]
MPQAMKEVKQPRPGQPLNQRVCIVYSQRYQINLGGLEKMHSFDIHKYAKIYLRLLQDGLMESDDVYVPESATEKQIRLVHTEQYLQSLSDSHAVARYLELPIAAYLPDALVDKGILSAFRYAAGGTILAGRLALKNGIAINIGGGYHHAKPDKGEGFCIYADMPIAIRSLQAEGLIRRALVVDLDVHQGNGTAECFAGDRSVYTFSMHEGNIYPIPKARSDCDVELSAGTNDEQYMKILRRELPRTFRRAKPDIVFYQAGCDTLADDPLAHLAMTGAGINQRDMYVIEQCIQRKIPVVMVLGGGYSSQAWSVQYGSIRDIIKRYGLAADENPQSRKPTAIEKIYSK